MKDLPGFRFLPALVAVAALAALYGLALAGHPVPLRAAQPVTVPRSVPVNAVQRGCPGLGLVGGSSGRVAVVAASAPAGSGQAVVTALSRASHAPLLTVTRPGRLSLGTVHPPGGAPVAQVSAGAAGGQVASVPLAGGVVVNASGAMARGLAVEQTGLDGVPAAPCTSPGTDFWFTGPGELTARQIRLYLMNPAGQAADVSVEIATDAGPLQGSPDAGIAVAPHSMVMQSLASLVRGSRVISLHVRTSIGQVVAAVRETASAAGGGGAWLPAAQDPATRVVVPGLPGTPGTRRLFVAVPGQQDARVTISAVTTRGTYEPTGGGGFDVPGGSGAAIDLPSMAGIPGALRLTSTHPVTASLMIPGGPAGAPGLITAAAPPLQEQGVAAANLAGAGNLSELVLTAPRHKATVKITELPTGGGRTVVVKAGRSTVVQLPRIRGSRPGAPFPVVVTPLPGSGPVYAGRVVMSGGTATVRALTPLASALISVPLPRVRAAPITAVP